MKSYFTSEVNEVLSKSRIVKNLARKKFIASFVLALIESQKVQFKEIAHYLNAEATLASNETRIQDFFRQVELDYRALAVLLVSFLGAGKVSLCVDRTEWDFCCFQANILMVLARQGDHHIPLYWELLDNKSGNSSREDRIDLLAQCVALLGKTRIGMVVADREFVGQQWLSYLKKEGILFCIRMPKHHLITRLDGQVHQADTLAAASKGEVCLADCLVDGVWGNVSLKKRADGELFYLFGTVKTAFLRQLYAKRWTIEACFQNFKGRGFDLESTHLKKREKLKKLLGLVSIAYGLCLNFGLYQHQRVKTIAVKNHGYKANSFFRHGQDCIRYNLRIHWRKNQWDWKLFLRLFLRHFRQVWTAINDRALKLAG